MILSKKCQGRGFGKICKAGGWGGGGGGGGLWGIMYRRGFRPSAHYECGTDTCGEFIHCFCYYCYLDWKASDDKA